MTTYENLGKQVGALVDEKNQAYGNSFQKTAEYLKVLFPGGIDPEQYVHLGLLIRMFDKVMRIATGHYEDSYRDLAGYALLGERLVRLEAGAKFVTNTDQPAAPREEPEPTVKVVYYDPADDTWDSDPQWQSDYY